MKRIVRHFAAVLFLIAAFAAPLPASADPLPPAPPIAQSAPPDTSKQTAPVILDLTDTTLTVTKGVDPTAVLARQADIRLGIQAFRATFNLPNSFNVTIAFDDMPEGMEGAFVPALRTVFISAKAEYAGFTALHELSHAFDNEVMFPALCKGAAGSFASESLEDPEAPNHDEIAPWKHAINDSATGQALSTLSRMACVNADPDTAMFLGYVQLDTEEFARSSAQFIAQRSGLMALMIEAHETALESYPLNSGWLTDADFAPIDIALRDLFQKNNWLTAGK